MLTRTQLQFARIHTYAFQNRFKLAALLTLLTLVLAATGTIFAEGGSGGGVCPTC
jgi:hypothetical protein